MKLTNKEITEARVALNRLTQEKLPVRVSWNLVILSSKLTEAVDAFVTVRDGLLKKYNIEKHDQEDGTTRLSSDTEGNVERFEEEWQELLGQEVELVITKVSLPERILSVCEKCGANMTRDFEVEAELLLPLVKVVEIL